MHTANNTASTICRVHRLLPARDFQDRIELDRLCSWWEEGGAGVCALVGLGGAGKTAIAEKFLRLLPGVIAGSPDEKEDMLPKPTTVFIFSFYEEASPEIMWDKLYQWCVNELDCGDDRRRLEDQVVPASAGLAQKLLRELSGKNLIILDGLEKVQDDGFRGGLFGHIPDGHLRDFMLTVADGLLSAISVIITTRFRLSDPVIASSPIFLQIPVDRLTTKAARSLLRARGVRRGSDDDLDFIANEFGRHALTIDLLGGYIARFYRGNPSAMGSDPILEKVSVSARDTGADLEIEALRAQEKRFARLAARYRETLERRDPAALAALIRVCLFRLGVTAETLASIFLRKNFFDTSKRRISGRKLASLSYRGLVERLEILREMRLIESTATDSGRKMYMAHPAVRDGFIKDLDGESLRKYHDAVRQDLETNLKKRPGYKEPSDPEILDLLEEIIHHTLEAGYPDDAFSVYWDLIGAYLNFGWRLGAYERGERICCAFLKSVGSEPAQIPISLSEQNRKRFVNQRGLYLKNLGHLSLAVGCYKEHNELCVREDDLLGATIGKQNLAIVLSLRGRTADSLATIEEALVFAEGSKEDEQIKSALGLRAHVRGLRGDIEGAFADFMAAEQLQQQIERNPDRPLWQIWGIFYAELLLRIGRVQGAKRLAVANKILCGQVYGKDEPTTTKCNLLLAEIAIVDGDLKEANLLHAAGRDWALSRDAKEPLCWSACVRARIGLEEAKRSGGKDKVPALEQVAESIREGMRVARSCGYSLFNIDLLLARAQMELLRGDGLAAERSTRTALFGLYPAVTGTDTFRAVARDESTSPRSRGIFPPLTANLPSLLAARNPQCGYRWGEAGGRYFLAEALCLRSAQLLGKKRFRPRSRNIPAPVRKLIHEASSELVSCRNLWRDLKDSKVSLANDALARFNRGTLTEFPLMENSHRESSDIACGEGDVLASSGSGSDGSKSTTMVPGFIDSRHIKSEVDFGVIAIREDEFEAVLMRLAPDRYTIGRRRYEVGCVSAAGGGYYRYAAVRLPEQGQGLSQKVASDLISDLDPRWIILVGICGAVPSLDFSLGDVVCATRVHDFCVGSAKEGSGRSFNVGGGPMHPEIQSLLGSLPAIKRQLEPWNTPKALSMWRPPLTVPPVESDFYYGDDSWKIETHRSLEHHFAGQGEGRRPLVTARSVASSDTLVKSTGLMKQWHESARSVAAVEMELSGIYLAARNIDRECPVLAIRGISDVVGFRREEQWTKYGCHTAAAFLFALLRAGVCFESREGAVDEV